MNANQPMGAWLYDSLPEVYQVRDAAQGYPLRAFLAVLGEQGDALWDEAQRLYDNQFLETCEPWLVPYLAALLGYRPIHAIGPVSQRALAAQWIALVRSKGTAATLEEVARGATGWPARVVEFFQLLAHPQHANHAREQVHGALDLRNARRLEDLGSAFDSAHYSVDAGRIARREGLHNIANVGPYLWRLRATPWPRHRALRIGTRRYACHPLGLDTQCFNLPLAEPDRRSLAQPVHLPIPFSRRRLHEAMADFHPRAFDIWIDGIEVTPAALCICNLSDQGATWTHLPDTMVAFDPVLGRIATPASAAAPNRVEVLFHDAFPGEVGGGAYERAASFAEALVPLVPVNLGGNLQTAIDAVQTGGTVELRDSERFDGAFAIEAAADERIELRAANGERPVLGLTADLEVTGGAESEVTINGLMIAGGALVVPDDATNALRRLTLRHVTLLPGITAAADGTPQQPQAPSLVIEAPNVLVEIERSVLGGIRAHPSTVIVVRDSAIDACERENVAFAALNGIGAAGLLTIEDSTVIGKIHARVFTLVSNSIFDAALAAAGETWPLAIEAEDTQQGCARFSWIPSGSRVPRRYRCQPSLALGEALRAAKEGNPALAPLAIATIERRIVTPLKPAYTARRYGRPGYLQLLTAAPATIRTGADDESEMGLWSHVHQPQRESNFAVRIEEFLPSRLEANHVYAT
ncbi:MAG: hypothetical protein H0T54_04510 [Geodermatophilaceae bacterium]|nr:hypothetical protein [Geodermatophilaceae bacterium]